MHRYAMYIFILFVFSICFSVLGEDIGDKGMYVLCPKHLTMSLGVHIEKPRPLFFAVPSIYYGRQS